MLFSLLVFPVTAPAWPSSCLHNPCTVNITKLNRLLATWMPGHQYDPKNLEVKAFYRNTSKIIIKTISLFLKTLHLRPVLKISLPLSQEFTSDPESPRIHSMHLSTSGHRALYPLTLLKAYHLLCDLDFMPL